MPRREYSDSTYDALAEGRAEAQQRRQDTPVGELIDEHRALYKADITRLQLHSRDGEDQGIGVPFSPVFEHIINWEADPKKRWHQEAGVRPMAPSVQQPWITAKFQQWAECRRSHPGHHERPEWRGSLCLRLVEHTVCYKRSLHDACAIIGVTQQRAGLTLRSALMWIERTMDEQRASQEREQKAQAARSPSEWIGVAPEHHVPAQNPEHHIAECDNPVCRARRAA